MRRNNCKPNIDWFGLIVGSALFGTGTILTTTVVGAIVGIPLILASLGLFSNPTTMRGTPCAH